MTTTTKPEKPPLKHPVEPRPLPERDTARRLLLQMLRVRRFEAACVEQYSKEKIRGFLHLYDGEEAVAAGVLGVLRADEAVVATYREHAHALLKGISARAVMAEMFGKATGASRGRGGSMHVFDAATRFFGGMGIVGAGIPVAVGLALADKIQQRPRATACFFGEGACAEGAFHEAMNLAALWRLPVLLCCENNLYAMGTALSRSESEVDLVQKAASYGVVSEAVDGMDVLAVLDAAKRALEAVRAGQPRFLELRTYRFRAHSMFDAQLYRDKAEVERWKERDPIEVFQRRLIDEAIVTAAEVEAMARAVDDEVADAVRFADDSPLEPVEDLLRHVVAESPATTSATTVKGGR